MALVLAGGPAAGCNRGAASTAAPRDDIITAEELDAAGTASVYDVIVRGHALFLRNRGKVSINGDVAPRAIVFLGDTEYGEIETLRNQPASRFDMVRYFTGTQASAKFGSRYSGGVIQLVPKS
jgi:hypothetical protein